MENQDPSTKENITSLLQKFKGPTIGPTNKSRIRITKNLLKNQPLTQQKPIVLFDVKQPTLAHMQLLKNIVLLQASHPARSSPSWIPKNPHNVH